ncbi:uncharacterized protein LOC119101575 [Pollicipes pollicipes]|uniref:uncharacterized protein LOC119101575 n=1 Tax=Pollicipes pollicipes TaxID=41117 RepID=UPI0018855137|nr:uncharacterized protein LOC119101575 [Pollicipes pollicipes]
MFDSNGRPESGFSDGNSFWEGRFSQCNSVLHDLIVVNDTVHIKGRYYKALLSGVLEQEQQSFRVTVGTCFPDLCTNGDVKAMLNLAPGFMSLPSEAEQPGGVSFRTDDVTGIDVDKQFWRDYTAVGALGTVVVFVALAVGGTLVDLMEEEVGPAAAKPQPKGEEMRLLDGKPASYSALDSKPASYSAPESSDLAKPAQP